MSRLCAVLLAIAVAAIGAACHSRPAPPDVVMIVVDTLRADRLGSYGNGRGLTPVLDGLAGRGVRFEAAYAPCSWTMPSVASIFTSRLPSQHLVRDFDSKLSDEEITFAERLAADGFRTAGFTANFRLTGDLGYGQGFGTWRGFLNSPGSELKARGDVLREAALQWLDANPREGSAAPRLLYLQYMEPHEPFDAPAEFQARFAAGIPPGDVQRLNKWSRMLAPICTGWTGMACREPLSAEEMAQLGALYDAEVASVDHEIGRLLEGLEQRGILQHALVIVTADHGEEFMEHGSFGHGFNLFNTTVRVPLIVVGPEIPAGRVVRENVSLIDLAPTLLDLLHLAPDPHFEGRSLVPFLRNAAVDGGGRPDIIMQLPRNGAEADMRWHREALVRNHEKLVVSPDGVPTLYDMAADPAEQQPRDAAEARGLVAALETANAALASRQRSTEQKVVIDAATKEKLRALGYHTD